MAYLSGILALAAVWVFCAFLADRFRLNAALLPLPVLAGVAVWLCLWGFAGFLRLGGWLVYLAAAGCAVWLAAGGWLVRAARQLAAPGFVFFAAAGAVFFVLFAATKPMFIAWDEFTFWGTACKATKLGNALHAAVPGNVQAGSYNPGMMLLVYFFQFFGKGFSEWSAFFAYDTLFAACISAVAAPLDKKRWPTAAVLLAGCFLLPWFFSAPGLGGVSNIYCNVMGDLPLAFVFGGSMCLYISLHRRAAGGVLLAVTLGFLTLIKDMGLAYALIVAGLACADWLFADGWPGLKRLVKTLGLGAALAGPVLALFLGWSRYYAAATGASKVTVGSEEQVGYFGMLAQGVGQLLGLTGRTEKFEKLTGLMASSVVTVPVCLLGGGIAALAVIFGLLAVAWAALAGSRRRVVQFAVLGSACFGVFLLFHLFLYTFVLSEQEAYQLKDYLRYIGPYYLGWALGAVGLLALAAEKGVLPRVSRAAGLGLLVGVCLLAGVRGRPAAGFWNMPHTLYDERRDVAARAASVNGLLDWDDTVLLISQGDRAYRWNYYAYELNARLGRGFGGFGYGPDVEKGGTGWWDTTHMNLVNPVDAGEGRAEVYEYQTVCTAEDLKRFLLDRRYTHLLVDTSDAYFAISVAGAFGVTDLPAGRTDRVYLFRILYEDGEVRWEPVEGGTAG